jgi:hypothetical protein
MNSKRTFTWLTKAVAVAGASLVFASLASAQNFQGKFTLPRQAQWGTVRLQPGRYTLSVARADGEKQMVTVQSEAKGGSEGFILSQGHDSSARAETSSLVCIRSGGTLVVRAVEIGPLGETIYFQQPKGVQVYAQTRHGKKQTLLARAPELVQRVLVTTPGK